MDALTELCDVLAQNRELAGERIGWIWSRCPPPGSLKPGSPRLTNSQLNAILAMARFLSHAPEKAERDLFTVILNFLQAVSLSFSEDFWPKSFGSGAVASFFMDLMRYVATIVDSNPDLCAVVSGVIAGVIQSIQGYYYDSGHSRAFLNALAQNCPRLETEDVEKVSWCLLEQWIFPATLANALPSSSSDTSSQSSPYAGKQHRAPFLNGVSSPVSDGAETASSTPSSTPSKMKGKEEYRDDNANGASKVARTNGGGGGTAGRSSLDQLALTCGFNDGGAALKPHVIAFEEESVEALEKQEIAFRLFGHILDKCSIKDSHLQQLRIAAGKQLKALPTFLKIRKRDWSEQGLLLKTRINSKLSLCQAAAVVQTKSLLISDSDGKATKTILRETLALLLDAADACVVSSWRKLKTCEELFSTLLSGVAEAAITRGTQVLRVLLLRLKALVLMTCAQADTWGNNQGAMFETVIKTSCDIINFGWNKDRAPIESFILALAANIRERIDFGEQDHLTGPHQAQVGSTLVHYTLLTTKDSFLHMEMNKAKFKDHHFKGLPQGRYYRDEDKDQGEDIVFKTISRSRRCKFKEDKVHVD